MNLYKFLFDVINFLINFFLDFNKITNIKFFQLKIEEEMKQSNKKQKSNNFA